MPAMPTTSMTTPGSRLTATGLAVVMISVGTGVSFGGSLVLLLSFAGVLTGTSFIFAGVRMADDDSTEPTGRPVVLAAGVRGRALVHSRRRNLALAGLLLASVAATATVDRQTVPVLCFCMFVLLLLGLSLINVGVVLLGEQEHW